jgi:DNA-binding transcriptional regulator YiaG
LLAEENGHANGKRILWIESDKTCLELIKKGRRQQGISQENRGYKLGMSFPTINRWENAKTRLVKLARTQSDRFCSKMIRQEKL